MNSTTAQKTNSCEWGGSLVRRAQVLSVDADVCRLEISGDVFVAGIAFSCLVRPAPGDVVMAATHDSGESHVIAVIERPGGQDLCITLPADAVVSAPQGSIRVCADRDVTLASNDRLNLFSSRAVHKSREAVVDFDDTVAVGDRLQASYQAVHLVSRLISTVSRQVIKKAKSYIRRTEDCDQVESGQMTRKTEGLYTMDSKHTVMVSKKETKIDGERIFMG